MSERSYWLWLIIGLCALDIGPVEAQAGWQAGTARVAITPRQPLWMSGYASRTRPSEGAVHDLWAKGLALQDPTGRRALLITLDICGIDRELSNRIRDTLQVRHGLGRDSIVLACSHTHCGPVVGTNLLTMYKIDDAERDRIARYAKSLESAILNVAKEALGKLEDARITWGNGRCDFAVNRRTNREADVPRLRQKMALQGPDDHDVPVLRIARPDGSLLVGRLRLRLPLHRARLQQILRRLCGVRPDRGRSPISRCDGLVRRGLWRRSESDPPAYDRAGRDLWETARRRAWRASSTAPCSRSMGPWRWPTRKSLSPSAACRPASKSSATRRPTDFYIASRARHLLKILDQRGTSRARLSLSRPGLATGWADLDLPRR